MITIYPLQICSHVGLCVHFSLITTGYQAVQILHCTAIEYIRLLTRLINSSEITTKKKEGIHYFSSYFIECTLNQTSNQKIVLISYNISFASLCMANH